MVVEDDSVLMVCLLHAIRRGHTIHLGPEFGSWASGMINRQFAEASPSPVDFQVKVVEEEALKTVTGERETKRRCKILHQCSSSLFSCCSRFTCEAAAALNGWLVLVPSCHRWSSGTETLGGFMWQFL